MTLFQRYAFRQALWPFLTAMAALTGLAILTQSLSNVDLIADEGGTALIFIWITTLALPQVIALLIPIAVFLACAAALNRLMSDSEFTVAASAGMSRRQRLSPFVRLAVYAVLLNLLINLFVQPAAFREMRQALYEVRTDIATSFMRAGEFVPLGGDVTFYARDVSNSGVMTDVFIEDGRPGEGAAYVAARGLITRTERGPVMLLESGSRTALDENAELTSLTFQRYEFELSAFVDAEASFFFKESDKYLPELLDPSISDIARARGREDLLAEGHYRLSAPLYSIAFALIAAAAFMGVQHRRTGYGGSIIIAGAAALVLRLLGFAVQAAATDDAGMNALQYAIPMIGIILALLVIARPSRALTRPPTGASALDAPRAAGVAP
ncbi:MAG: LptF/LptG family permease [Pseudomonadota bacterium]